MNKLISVLLALVLMLGCFNTAYGASADWETIVFELSSLGVIEENADISLPVTRGEFALMIANLMGYGSIANAGSIACPFADVPSDAPYAAAVAILANMGIMNGTSSATFNPDGKVTVQQAAKVMVVCTGYDILAKDAGGWPYGYTTVGAQIGIMEDVDASNQESREQIYRVMHNALDVKLLKEEFGTGDIVKTNETLREGFSTTDGAKLYYLSGVVNANSFSYVSSPVSDLAPDEVVIDSVIYKIGDTDAFNLVGHRVNFFTYEKNGKYILKGITPDIDEEITKIPSKDVISKSGDVLNFYVGDKEKRIRVNSQTKVVYNGIRIPLPADSIWTGSIGTVTLIDHDGNGTADVALIDRYESYIAKSYSEGLFKFNDATKYHGKNSLYIDPYSSSKQFIVTDAAGNAVADFAEDRVVSVFADLGATRYRFVVSDLKTEGTLEQISDSGWMINNETYPLDASVTLTGYKLGKTYSVYLNFNNEIVYINEISADNYGYIIGTGSTGGFSKPQARLISAGKVDFGVDVNDDDVDDTNQIPFLVAQNKAITEFYFADKVVINGTSYKGNGITTAAAALSGRAVKYILNENGEISSVTILTKYAGTESNAQRLKYNVYEMVFGGLEENTARGFAINSDTMVICVPNSPSFSDADALTSIKVDVANNTVGYNVRGFEVDDLTKRAKLLVMYADMSASQVRPVSIDSSKAAVVSSVSQVFDEETGDVKTVVELMQDGVTKTFDTVDITSANATLGSLRKGDVINFITNQDGKLENVMRLRGVSSFTSDFRYNSSTGGYEEAFGLASYITTDEVDSLNYIMVTVLDISVNGVTYTYSIPQRNKPPVYIYYTNSEIVEKGDMSSIIPGGDKVYILKKNGTNTIKAVVVIR